LEDFGIFYGYVFGQFSVHFAYFMAIWYIVTRKIWQPCVRDEVYLKVDTKNESKKRKADNFFRRQSRIKIFSLISVSHLVYATWISA
jgi:hypothetical protein